MTSKSKIQRTYSCSVCGKKLSSSVALSAHLKIHSGIKSFCCEYCGALYSTKQNLTAHLLRIHEINIDSIRSCDICGKQFFRKCAFDSHYLIHMNQKPFNCHICHKYFRQKITRDLHVATHTGDYKYTCSKCGRKFLSAYKRKQHMEKKKDCSSELLSQPRADALNLDSFNLSRTEVLNLDSLTQLRAGALNLEDNITDEIVNSFNFDYHVTDKIWDLQEPSSFNLNQEETVKFYCAMPQCSEMSFKNKTVLKKHVSRTHFSNSFHENEVSNVMIEKNHSKRQSPDLSNAAEFSCTECYKQFKTLQGLEYHKKAHKGFYNFICDICGKLFIRNSHFISHMKTHSDIRPYCCSVCRKSYKSNKNLKEHMRLKHSML
ncbi:gastrula zinc finger protein XlCGF58.1 [Halyomorpha halys]|uniref:gastrula zinc finger protein XlCGF58.1 n=1 Tax=Halyomorpha halys TaxID=286706 RepID=UPI0006D50F69|nr:oocyte zinc finger protein XlCOF7.1-like [Halyomorpha halys]